MAFYTKIHLNQAFMAKTSCSCMYRGDFGKILCVEQRGPPPNPTIPPAVMQCCQVAEIPAKELKRGREKKVGRKNSWLKFGQMFPRVAEKGLKKIF
jgi:hypothetical protein